MIPFFDLQQLSFHISVLRNRVFLQSLLAPKIMVGMLSIPEIAVSELKTLMDNGGSPFILDVREEYEFEIANIGGTLIPLRELPQRLDELEAHKGDVIVVCCRSGVRSAQAVQYMRAFGFEYATNLKGGILAWSREIDPSIPTY